MPVLTNQRTALIVLTNSTTSGHPSPLPVDLALSNKRTSGHPVDNPGQFPSLSVVPVVIEQLSDGEDDQEGEHPTEGLD